MRGVQGVLPPWRDRSVHRAQGEPLSDQSSRLPQSTSNRCAGRLRSGGRARPEDRRPRLEAELGAQHLGAH